MAVWNTAFNLAPANGDSTDEGDDRIRETRVEIFNRISKEHQWGSSSITDGYHLEGAARAYIAASAPTVRPDGSTSLNTNDEGRIWYDSSDSYKGYVHTGSTWTSTITGAYTYQGKLVSGAGTANTYMLFGTSELYSWNMDSTASFAISLPTGWKLKTPIFADVIIREDGGTITRNLISGSNAITGHLRIDHDGSSWTLNAVRTASGLFDAAGYDDGTILRGYAFIVVRDD